MCRQANIAVVGIAVLCVAAGFCLTGCVSGRSDTRYGPSGPSVGRKTLRQIEPGQTSKEWVLGTLGTPTTETATPEGTELLTYEYTKKTDVDFNFCPFLSFDDKKEERTVIYFEVRNGIVTRYWKD